MLEQCKPSSLRKQPYILFLFFLAIISCCIGIRIMQYSLTLKVIPSQVLNNVQLFTGKRGDVNPDHVTESLIAS